MSQCISIPNSKQNASPSKKLPLESNALLHSSPPWFSALLEGLFSNVLQLHRYAPLDILHALKTGSLDDPLELGEKKKKMTWRKIR